MVTKSDIIHLLLTNDRAVERALVVLYARQTSDEQRILDTRYLNQRGFNVAHAKRMSCFARWVMSGRKLTPKQLAWCRVRVKGKSRITIYAGQLLEEAEAKAARRQAA